MPGDEINQPGVSQKYRGNEDTGFHGAEKAETNKTLMTQVFSGSSYESRQEAKEAVLDELF